PQGWTGWGKPRRERYGLHGIKGKESLSPLTAELDSNSESPNANLGSPYLPASDPRLRGPPSASFARPLARIRRMTRHPIHPEDAPSGWTISQDVKASQVGCSWQGE